MTVRRVPPLVLALVLGLLAALAVSCGDDSGDRKLLTPTRAEAIKKELDKIDERVEKGECADLEPAFIRLNRAVDELPRSTDRRLRRRLADGVANLRRIAPDDCRDNRPKTTETTETAPPETQPETVPETTTTPPETQPETVPETTTTPPQTTTTEPPLETEPPPDSGGSEAPGAGYVPPGQEKKGDKAG